MATTAERRAAAVAETIAQIRAIEAEKGVTPAAIEDFKQVLADLARRSELFPRSDFPTADLKNDIFIRLSEDDDKRFALYLNSGSPGKETPPHNHTTWAVIAGIDGEEHNKVYRRTDDGSVPGKGQVEVAFEKSVGPGEAIGFMPSDIHSIHVLTDRPILHLHMYGKGLEQLRGRIYFDVAAGTYSHFPSHPDIR
ncbi:MAG: cysteine dioxygenase family protein [Alphaproteobacteria bacterium]|nr:cysteine dioxygenase family protein [Alphaproteobacteria bacterium]MBU0797976.1 cysteine dioxygenase family protein [Alphaproteobacteria bacterium]MBU0887952.1 cysteine dioxygenase family protein [Alphaproteobacteria bacterium]MBU1814825.1 cysteine dioxygenase family protein [Alphaproteobacteria bacterium]